MNKKNQPDWNPRSEDVLRDQLAAYDNLREHCPVAYSEFMQWSIFRHEDVVRVILDHETFSSAVSQHLSVPGGMDPPEHTVYRKIIEPYFSSERMTVFEPICRNIAVDLTSSALTHGKVELMADVAVPFAVRCQCAFLGWSQDLEKPLADWTRRNYEATLAQDRQAMSNIARELEGFIDEMIEARLLIEINPENDVTASLMHDKVWGRPLSHEEIASIARTWTVGEIGSIAASIGILLHYMAEHVELQNQLRDKPSLLPAAIDEILRIHGPLVASRRMTTCPVEIAGRKIEEGERISLNWVSANRDEHVFEDSTDFRLDRNPDDNLLYGAGIHVCPGAPLARLEMRVFMEELLSRTTQIQLIEKQPPQNAVFPASGFATLPVQFQ
jgi:cytochrome P450